MKTSHLYQKVKVTSTLSFDDISNIFAVLGLSVTVKYILSVVAFTALAIIIGVIIAFGLGLESGNGMYTCSIKIFLNLNI